MLEGLEWNAKSFLTLTYTPEKEPKVASGLSSTLSPRDLQTFLKRFRKRIAPTKVRYFAVGEYGEMSGRPHFHLAMFGWPACAHGRTRKLKPESRKCCEACQVVKETWGHGHIMNAELNPETAQYVVGYVIKKMTSPDDGRLIAGQHAEFCRMSLRPGIGAGLVDDIASKVLQYDLEDPLTGDVPTALDHGRRRLPLGRYLTKRLRERTGRDAAAPQKKMEAMAKELQPLREFAFNNSRSLSEVVKEFYAPVTERSERLYRVKKRRGIF